MSDHFDHPDDFNHFDYIDAVIFSGLVSKRACETIQGYLDRWQRGLDEVKEVHKELENEKANED